MPAPADNMGCAKPGSTKTGPLGPASIPRQMGSGPGSQSPGDATLSPYLRRRLRSLAEALSDAAERRAAERNTAARPGAEAATGREAGRHDPHAPAPKAPDQDRLDGRQPAAVEACRQGRQSR